MCTASNSQKALALLYAARPYRLQGVHYYGHFHRIFASEQETHQFIAGLTRPEWLRLCKAINPTTWGANGYWRNLPNLKET